MAGRFELHLSDAREVLAGVQDCCVDAVVTDPPAGISFMGKTWDHDHGGRDGWVRAFAAIFAECLRVLKPGGHALVWALPRTSHWTACALEDAGFEVRDVITHHFGCVTPDTEMLTAEGWRRREDLRVGELVASVRPDGSLRYAPLRAVTSYPFDGDLVRITARGTDQLLTPGHRVWARAVRQKWRRREMDGELSSWSAQDLAEGEGPTGWRLPLAARGYEVGKSIGRDVAALYGWVVAEGYFHPDVSAVSIYQNVGSTCDELRDLLRRLGIPHSEYERERTYRGRTYRAVQFYLRAGPWSDRLRRDLEGRKPTPPAWLARLPRPEAEALFGALIAGDGSWSGPNSGAFYQERSEVRAWFQVLCVHLGYRTTENLGKNAVQFCTARGDVEVQRTAHHRRRWCARVPYRGEVWCPTTIDGTWVARRAGCTFVTGNTGFPKSLDVSTAIDKAAGAERRKIGTGRAGASSLERVRRVEQGYRSNLTGCDPGAYPITESATDDARRWEGWGTALKPATEHWILCRRPLDGTVAANVLKWSTGAINIDGTRVQAHRTGGEGVGGEANTRGCPVHGLRGVREGDAGLEVQAQAGEAARNVREGVQGRGDAGPVEPQVEGRGVDQQQDGISPRGGGAPRGRGPGAAADADAPRGSGTPAGDGARVGEVASAARARAPRGRRQGEQRARESAADGLEGTQQGAPGDASETGGVGGGERNLAGCTCATVGRWPTNLMLSHVEHAWYVLTSDDQSIRAYYGEDQALRALRGEHQGDAVRAGEAEVLFPGVRWSLPEGHAEEGVGEDRVPGVREGLRGHARVGEERAEEVLLQDVPREGEPGGAPAGRGAHGRGAREDARRGHGQVPEGELVAVEGREVQGSKRVRARDGGGVAGARSDTGQADHGTEVHPGAPRRGRDDLGPSPSAGRDRASLERGEGRQPAGELDGRGARRSQQGAPGGRAAPGGPGGGERTAARGGLILEVVEELIPTAWLDHFEFSRTSGCVPAGTRKVKTGTAVQRHGGGQAIFGGIAGTEGNLTREDASYGRNGVEEVEAFDCAPGCPVAEMDARNKGASRFFPRFRYQAKASSAERGAGLPEGERNRHPTVKSVELMRWLVRLVCPPGGLVLDPFCGSGSTGVACVLEGVDFAGIEREAEYLEVARSRIEHAVAQVESS